MANPSKSNSAKQSKNLAYQIAKQIAQEPIEIAKTALGQVSGLEKDQKDQNNSKGQNKENDLETVQNEKLLEQKNKAQGQRQIQALENELKDIVERKKLKKQKEEVFEQEQKLAEDEKQQASPLIEPSVKKSRNFFTAFGRKPKAAQGSLQAERQKTRVERVIPPTG